MDAMSILHRCAASVATLVLAVSPAFAAQSAGTPPEPLASADLITLADATRMAHAALAECTKRGQPASVLVVDATGLLRAAFVDDNGKAIGVDHNNRKVAAVLAFKVSTQALQARVQSDKPFADKYSKDERYFLMGGGLPIYRNGTFVAAISAGGAGGVNNEPCAIAGVKAISWASYEK